MKVQIRRGVFETNSSSTHSLTIVSKSSFDKWLAGEVYYSEYNKGDVDKDFMSKEGVNKVLMKRSDTKTLEDIQNLEEDELSEIYGEEGFYTYESYEELKGYYYSTFEEKHTFGAEEIVAFGYYGMDT